MTVFIAAVAGLGTLIGANTVLALIYGVAKGSSQFLNALLGQTYIGLLIRLIGWFGAAWAGLSVFDSLGGF